MASAVHTFAFACSWCGGNVYICATLEADGCFISFVYMLLLLNQTFIPGHTMGTWERDTKFSTGILKGRESGAVGLDNAAIQK
jgi:hypothetical protein